MTTANPRGSIDGTTVTVRPSAEQAERALSAARYVVSMPILGHARDTPAPAKVEREHVLPAD